jgi:hypothetical protein
MSHRALRVDLRGLLKRANRRAMIETVNQRETLIEVTLRLRGLRRDLTRINAKTFVKRFLGGKIQKAGQSQPANENTSDK